MFLTFLHQLFDSTHDLRGKDSGLGHRPAPKSQHSQRGAEFSEPKTAPDQRLQCAAREPSCTSLTGNSPQTHWHLPPKTCSVLLIRPLLGSSTCQPRLPTPAHATFRAHALCMFFRQGMRRRPKISAALSTFRPSGLTGFHRTDGGSFFDRFEVLQLCCVVGFDKYVVVWFMLGILYRIVGKCLEIYGHPHPYSSLESQLTQRGSSGTPCGRTQGVKAEGREWAQEHLKLGCK